MKSKKSTYEDNEQGKLSLHTSEFLFNTISSTSQENQFIVRVKNKKFYIHWANKAIEDMGGVPLAELIGKTLTEILGDKIGTSVENNYRQCLESRQPYEYEETTLDDANQVQHWHTLLVPVCDQPGHVIFIHGISRNVTNIVNNIKQLEQANQTKVNFLSHMSHEVKTPLHCISGAVSLLKMGQLSDQQKSLIDIIDVSLEPIMRLSKDLLDHTTLDAGKLYFQQSSFNLTELLKDIYTMMAILAEQKSLKLHLNIISAPNVSVIGDCGRIKQVLCNLLSNAIKFTSHGEVLLKVEYVAISDQALIDLSVSDSGIGIATEDIDKLFQPFTLIENKNKQNIQGTGLGLSISKELVERMGGSISVKSELNKGTQFTVLLKLPLASKN